MDLEGCYMATEDYLKQDVDELDLYEGQIVCVIDDSDDGEITTYIYRACKTDDYQIDCISLQ